MLYFIHTLEQALQPHILRITSCSHILDFKGMLLLEHALQYDPSYVCLAAPETAADVLKSGRGGCLIAAGGGPGLLSLPCPVEMTLIVTDLSMIALNNLLNQMLFQADSIYNQLAFSSPYQTRNLLKAAHQLSDASFAILDSNGTFLYDSIRLEDSDFYISLVQEAAQVHDLVSRLFGVSRMPSGPLLSLDGGRILLFLPFYRNTNNYLLCTAPAGNPLACQAAMILRDLCEPLLSNRMKASPNKNMSFQLFFSRLMSENGDSDDSLMIMLHSMANPPMKNMRLVLVRSEICPEGNPSVSLEHLLPPVAACFPGANITITATEIVVLVSSATMYCPLPIDTRDFEKTLEENHALAVVGNPFTSIMSMRVTCRQCQRIFPIAMAVKLGDETRCMSFARYTHYNVIDICARSIVSVLGGSDIVILTHPGVVNLTRYDRANGTNLRDIMFHYLMNDRSIIKTSKQMFLHRNTLIYKVKKIEELIGESMDDPYLRHNLVFSCLLLRYRELYQKEGVSFSRFEPVKIRHRDNGKQEP